MDFLNKTRKKDLKQKKEHRHRILYTENGLGIKFQPKLKILIYWSKLT